MGNLFGNGQTGQIVSSLLVYAVVILGLYFVMFRPNQKRRKQEEEMKKSLTIGDEVTTIGGILGSSSSEIGNNVSAGTLSANVTLSNSIEWFLGFWG